jgi:hypothetical protein
MRISNKTIDPKGSIKTKTVIAKGQKVRVTVAGKVIKTVMK